MLIAGLLILARWAAALWLARLNERHVLAHADAVPEAFKDTMDTATYQKSVQYTLAKGRLGQVEICLDTAVLLAVLFTGVLPWASETLGHGLGVSNWGLAGVLTIIGVFLSLPSLPLEWYAQFHLEQRFGFNTTTARTWWLDRLKGLVLCLLLGYPLIALVLQIVQRAGSAWWIWAWFVLLGFQLLMLLAAPVLILPWFNRFTPLPAGSLRDRLFALAQRANFRARSIQVMDGSRRSRHSNAFFTGVGRFRKIVLFDTLIHDLVEPELEAVLAHEIGHYKKRHIPKLLLWSALSQLAGFCALAWLARQDWFYRSFGFQPGNLAPALLLFGLLAGVVVFWLSPLANRWSRRFEYQADAYAVALIGEPHSLTRALRKLNQKNLSNLTPHPLYSGFYYSHPTLLEREQALGVSPRIRMTNSRTDPQILGLTPR